MFEGLNKYGLPVKYGILCTGGGIAGIFLAHMLGLDLGGATYLSTAIACGIGGAVGGWIRQRKGKNG